MNATARKSLISEVTRQSIPARKPLLESRPQTPVFRPMPSLPSMDRVEMSSKAQEIQASDALKSNWSQMLNSGASLWVSALDPAATYRSTTKVPLEGYDQAKLDNPDHRTPKYVFGRVAQNFKLDSVQGDKAKAEQLLKAMLPELQAAGLEVVGVAGDRIQVKTEVGYEWVDVVRGAGSDSPGWWWGSEGKGTAQPTNTVKEWAAQTGVGLDSGASAPAVAAQGMAPSASKKVGLPGPESGPVLAILKKYSPTNDGIRAAMAEVQKLHPGAKILDHPVRLDKIQFADGRWSTSSSARAVPTLAGAGCPSNQFGLVAQVDQTGPMPEEQAKYPCRWGGSGE